MEAKLSITGNDGAGYTCCVELPTKWERSFSHRQGHVVSGCTLGGSGWGGGGAYQWTTTWHSTFEQAREWLAATQKEIRAAVEALACAYRVEVIVNLTPNEAEDE